ncbi:carbonic anhydrase IV c [Lates japonicus]|uniref:Carbonic anhydrase IV c n=1 Tax=Lates japonicus TaxID=270547 RepID=A0AAD3M3C1_LATJO|nr:carbonic anhydrase IV c [Lates japonicus]
MGLSLYLLTLFSLLSQSTGPATGQLKFPSCGEDSGSHRLTAVLVKYTSTAPYHPLTSLVTGVINITVEKQGHSWESSHGGSRTSTLTSVLTDNLLFPAAPLSSAAISPIGREELCLVTTELPFHFHWEGWETRIRAYIDGERFPMELHTASTFKEPCLAPSRGRDMIWRYSSIAFLFEDLLIATPLCGLRMTTPGCEQASCLGGVSGTLSIQQSTVVFWTARVQFTDSAH